MTSPNIAAESASTARYGDSIDSALNNDYRASTDPGLSSRPRSRQPGRSALHRLPPGHLEPSRDAPPTRGKASEWATITYACRADSELVIGLATNEPPENDGDAAHDRCSLERMPSQRAGGWTRGACAFIDLGGDGLRCTADGLADASRTQRCFGSLSRAAKYGSMTSARVLPH
jgi:hypothetical protein